MNKKENKQENDVYFLGSNSDEEKKSVKTKTWIISGICILIVLIIITICVFFLQKKEPEHYFEPEAEQLETEQNVSGSHHTHPKDSIVRGYMEVMEETINDVPLFVYVPHHAEMSLSIGVQDKADSSIVFVAQAADIRADNLEILGDFVLNGEKLARGVAKAGFCAIIDGHISIGVSKNTPLLQKTIESNGYFFRQYPLVDNGELVENNPKNKSIRRAIALKGSHVVMVESRSNESFHDFAQALIDIGVSNAIYLVGGTSHGWYFDKDSNRREFGIEKDSMPEKTSYIVWHSK